MADHAFDPIFAKKYGIVSAVLIHDFAYWINHNRANQKNMHDGMYWTYNSAKAFARMYPYMGRSQIYSALNKMIDDGIIIKSEFNYEKWDHTPWYTITDKGYAVIAECAMLSEKLVRGESGNRDDDVQKTETTTSENEDIDVQKIVRRRTEIDTSYINTNNIRTTPDTYPYAYDHLNTNSSSEDKQRKANDIPDSFMEFYEAYPRKVAKQNAIKAWKALKPDAETVEKIIADIHLRLKTEWQGKDMQYIPHPSSYLNQRRWEDETAPKDKPPSHDIYDGIDNSAYGLDPF